MDSHFLSQWISEKRVIRPLDNGRLKSSSSLSAPDTRKRKRFYHQPVEFAQRYVILLQIRRTCYNYVTALGFKRARRPARRSGTPKTGYGLEWNLESQFQAV